jgi:mono/diheme cytochrome c family protein
MRLIITLAWLVCLAPSLAGAQGSPAAAVPAGEQALIDQGRYLATAGDCMACHTVKDGPAYAGGYSVQSPLGAIYATNITPSKTAGIGNYTEAQFARAVRDGVRADGAHLYPAMPYTAYAKLTDQDVHALYLYFMKGVAPVDHQVAKTELPFPFNIRMSMAAWNLMFLNTERFQPDTTKSEQINRGAYLVNGLAHCSTCHTPRNALMAEQGSRFLGGAALGAWYAPNISPDPGAHPVRVHDVLPHPVPGHHHRPGQLPGRARSCAGCDQAPGLRRPVPLLAEDLRRHLRHGRGLGHRDGLPVRHQLELFFRATPAPSPGRCWPTRC